jgi:hypothetical protein
MRVVFYEEKRVHFPEIEFRLFRRPNFLSITPLTLCVFSFCILYFIVDCEFSTVADILIVILKKIYLYLYFFSWFIAEIWKATTWPVCWVQISRASPIYESCKYLSPRSFSLPCSIVLRRVVETAAGGPRKGLFLSGDVISRFAPIPIVTLLTSSY